MGLCNKMRELQEFIQENLGEYIEAPWTIIESYFKGQHLRHISETSNRIL